MYRVLLNSTNIVAEFKYVVVDELFERTKNAATMEDSIQFEDGKSDVGLVDLRVTDLENANYGTHIDSLMDSCHSQERTKSELAIHHMCKTVPSTAWMNRWHAMM